ncbi:MAG: DNA translocase FtsK 4TM domain-containing protein [Acidobacteriota bacterium]|nr:DNA translocase FtsK 4TM domain-containing protein [Acidobacteriota bacterium]
MSGSALSRWVSEFVGIALFAGALFILIALTTYDPADPVWFFTTTGPEPPANFAGRVGAFLAELSYQLVGFSAYLLPAVLVSLGWHYFWCKPIAAVYTKVIGLTLTTACTASFTTLAFGAFEQSERPFRAGGYIGGWLADGLAEYLNRTGSIILILPLLFLALLLMTQLSFGQLFSLSATRAGETSSRIQESLRVWWGDRRRARERRDVVQKHLRRTGASSARTEVLAKSAAGPPRRQKKRSGERQSKRKSPAIAGTPPAPQPLPLPDPPGRTPVERLQGSFQLPPLSLLDPPREHHKFDERELLENARHLENKCHEFAVEGKVIQIHPGPVVTTFEFKPDAGVKYSKVTGLADDLCLAMQAESVLIERLPGKSTVGIQIPNRVREQISLRQMLESEPYCESESMLALALGRLIHGEPIAGDLATMPHLLIAGSTGTGKSVSMNAMLTSILYRATPDDVRFIMIDPKRLELGMYEDIPHLLTPVVVEPKMAANALRWAVHEMEERYKKLAAEGVRNLAQFNRNIRQQLLERAKHPQPAQESGAEEQPKPLPYIVLAIDELADLMMLAGNEVEESIARLAQMARAVGIHLILATQRPSVDVITGLIKANLPSRIAFRVSSKVDSRTILDGNGAEQLLGRGDMLYLPPASSRVVRVHGPYISEQETARVCGFLRKQGRPAYDAAITAEEKQGEVAAFERDDLYDEAARIVVAAGQASISYLQRRLRIGFSRAARLVDMMEVDGLVSAGGSGKAREVLVGTDYFKEVDMQLR